MAETQGKGYEQKQSLTPEERVAAYRDRTWQTDIDKAAEDTDKVIDQAVACISQIATLYDQEKKQLAEEVSQIEGSFMADIEAIYDILRGKLGQEVGKAKSALADLIQACEDLERKEVLKDERGDIDSTCIDISKNIENAYRNAINKYRQEIHLLEQKLGLNPSIGMAGVRVVGAAAVGVRAAES